MRKITSRHEESKRKRRNQWIVGIILIGVMLFSVLGYGFGGGGGSTSNKVDYNGFKFINQNGLWFLNIGNFDFVFKYNPKQVEKINSELNFLDGYYGKPLYIFSENDEAIIEVYNNLNQVVQRIQPACLNEEECEENWPVKTCKDNFIIIKEGDKNEIIQDENCVFINGKKEDLTKITDEFLFKIIGVE